MHRPRGLSDKCAREQSCTKVLTSTAKPRSPAQVLFQGRVAKPRSSASGEGVSIGRAMPSRICTENRPDSWGKAALACLETDAGYRLCQWHTAKTCNSAQAPASTSNASMALATKEAMEACGTHANDMDFSVFQKPMNRS